MMPAVDVAITGLFIGMAIVLIARTRRLVRAQIELERQLEQLREILEHPDWRDRR